MKRLWILSVTALSLAACATPAPRQTAAPALDMKKVNQVRYEADLGECRAIADNVLGVSKTPPSKSQQMKTGLVQAAKTGAVAVVKTGGNVVASTAAIANNLSGNAAMTRSQTIVSNCLKGRGYKVLE